MFKQGEMKDYPGAEQDYTNAINLKPGNLLLPSLYLYRGGLRFQNLQNKKRAIADLQEAVQICKQKFSDAECVTYTHAFIYQLTLLTLNLPENLFTLGS